MNDFQIRLENEDGIYRPGDTLVAAVAWEFAVVPRSIEARLFWFTQGKGTTDTQIVDSDRPEQLTAEGRWRIELLIPADAPPSYSGNLLSVRWALEIVAEKKLGFGRENLIVSPTGAALVPPDRV